MSRREASIPKETNQVHEPEKESGLYAKAGEHIIDLNHDKSESSSQYNSWLAANRDNVIDEENAAANDKVLKAENKYTKKAKNVSELNKELFKYKLKSASFFVRMGYYLAIFMSIIFFGLAVMLLLNASLGGCFIFGLISIFFYALGRSTIQAEKPK